MKKHNGMRPQDVVILLKIVAKGNESWYMKDLSQELDISASEVSESLNRSSIAGLVTADKKVIQKRALLEFLIHGMKYVYPRQPGNVVRGMPTAHSAPPLSNQIKASEQYVWPWAKGRERGQKIDPLHPSVPEACSRDGELYELLSLVDALCVGRRREQNIAEQELTKRIKQS
jgi:predicted transcriptional regulator